MSILKLQKDINIRNNFINHNLQSPAFTIKLTNMKLSNLPFMKLKMELCYLCCKILGAREGATYHVLFNKSYLLHAANSFICILFSCLISIVPS